MDLSLYLSEQHFQVRDMVREFGRTEVAPVARELDRTSTFPWDNIRKMADLGLLGVPWSEEMGGAGMDQLSYYITIHELAKVDASHALTISAHTNLGTSPIMDFGTQAQKEKYVPLLASGKVLGGFGLTEPGAGSDAGGTATTAVDKGDHFVLNGSKIFITHAGVGEIFSVTARTQPGHGSRGITSFLVTKDTVDLDEAARVGVGHAADLPKTPGVRAGKKEDKMGWRASDTRELVFEDAIVPKENLLGTPGDGFVNFLKTLDAGRIGIAALSLGIAEGAYDEALKYAGVRKQFGRSEELCIAFDHPCWVGGRCVLKHQVMQIFVEEDGSSVEVPAIPLRLAIGEGNRTRCAAEIDPRDAADPGNVRDFLRIPQRVERQAAGRGGRRVLHLAHGPHSAVEARFTP